MAKKKKEEISDLLNELQKAHDIYVKRYAEVFQEYQARINNILHRYNGTNDHNGTNKTAN